MQSAPDNAWKLRAFANPRRICDADLQKFGLVTRHRERTFGKLSGGEFWSEWTVAGTAAGWQDVDVSQSAGEIVPDRKLRLPPKLESGSRRDGIRMKIWESLVCPIFNVTVRRNRTLFG
jgi:hypothetical protein